MKEKKIFFFPKHPRRISDCSHLEAVVSPRAEFHYARLLVERKIFDVNLAGRLINRRRFPLDSTRVVESCLRRQRHLEITVGAVEIHEFPLESTIRNNLNVTCERKKNGANANRHWRDALTCCIKLYRASIYDLTARAASPLHRTPSDPTSTCNRTMTTNRGFAVLSHYPLPLFCHVIYITW